MRCLKGQGAPGEEEAGRTGSLGAMTPRAGFSSASLAVHRFSAEAFVPVLQRLPPSEIEQLRLLFERLDRQRRALLQRRANLACPPSAAQMHDEDAAYFREIAAGMFAEAFEEPAIPL